jgi:hypothetical protein
MKKWMIVLFAFLCLVPQSLWAKIHSIARNVATVIDLQDNDEIGLVDFPNDWAYSRIVLGVNSMPAVQLSGFLVTNDCIHELSDYYNEIAFAYTGEDKIVYHGPSQSLPIQWWADANPVLESCKSYTEKTKRDSVLAIMYDYAESVYFEKIKSYRDLGELNSTTPFEGSSAKFKITKLPSWFYNRICVQVEPVDNRELDGYAYIGGAKAEIKGYSAKFAINQKTLLAPSFELAFPENRKVKLKWWAETGTPTEIQIEAKEKSLTSDSVEVEYAFGEDLYSNNSVKLVFDKRQFIDGKIPVVKKMSFNPYGPNKSRNLGIYGDVYKIEAQPKFNDSIVMALPLYSGYQLDKDSVLVEYYDDDEKKWEQTPIDSIVGNAAFFTSRVSRNNSWKFLIPVIIPSGTGTVVSGATGAFILSDATVQTFIAICKSLKDKGCPIDDVEKSALSFIDWALSTDELLHQGLKWNLEILKRLACLDLPALFAIFGKSKTPKWDPEQGNVDWKSLLKNERFSSLLSLLVKKRAEGKLVDLSDPSYSNECKDESGNISEVCLWQRTRENLDLLLADAILAKFYGTNAVGISYGTGFGLGLRRFKFEYKDDKGIVTDCRTSCQNKNVKTYDYDNYFMTRSGLIEDAAGFVAGAQACNSSFNITGHTMQNYYNLWNGVKNLSYTDACDAILGFATSGLENAFNNIDCAHFLNATSTLDQHEGKLIAISEAMVRISLLAWLNKSNDFRNYTLLRYKAAYDGVRSWLELAGPFLHYNNIVIKAFSSLALFEYLHYGTDDNLKTANAFLNLHYGDNGGYSEGTGYSQYIWEDVPYVFAALMDAYKSQNESENFSINEKFLKSPDYMFEFSRPVGLDEGNGKKTHYGRIPVEVDDGVTYNPDYRVWAKLKNDPKYLAMSEKYGLSDDKKSNPLLAFGFPDTSMNFSEEKKVPNRDSLWADFKDGIGMITAVNGDDTVALSMIAENGFMWTLGQAHDQQDNLSITLTSSKKGFLIQDPGYSGFSFRSESDGFHNYHDHNVLKLKEDILSQDNNKSIRYDELMSRLDDFSHDFLGVEPAFLAKSYTWLSNYNYSLTVEGGEEASISSPMINEPQNGIIAFTAATKLNKLTHAEQFDNHRTIMYYADNFWVFDRPEGNGLLEWQINSPMKKWMDIEDVGVHVYSAYDDKPLTLKRTPETDNDSALILQNGSRIDYEQKEGQYYLRNYKYKAFDYNTKTYVMTYSLGNETFAKDYYYNSTIIIDNQSFVNSAKTIRVFVPPLGEATMLCLMLPKNECSGNIYSNGITILEKMEHDEWKIRVIDGTLATVENGIDIPLKSATVTGWYYIYERMDGTFVDSRDSLVYLPALPILLLR